MRTLSALNWSVLLALAAPALAQSQPVATDVTSATDVIVTDAAVDSSTDTGAMSTATVANLTPTASPSTETGSAGGMNGTTGGTNGTTSGLGSSLNLSARCLAAVEQALSADSATGQCLHTTILWASASSNSTASNSTASNSTVPESTANSTASNSTTSPFVSKVEQYLNATCMSAPCTNATISNATSILIQECSEDLATWNISVDTVNQYAQLYPLVREVVCLKTSDPFTAAGNSTSSNSTSTPPVMTSTALATPVVSSTGVASNQTVTVNRRQATETANSGLETAAGNASAASGAPSQTVASATPATTSAPGSDNSTTVASEYCVISLIDEIQSLLGTQGLSFANITQLLIPGSLLRNSTASSSSSGNSTTPVLGNSTASVAPMASSTSATSSNTTSANSTSANSNSTSSTSPPRPMTLLPLIMEVLCNDCIYAAADLVSQSAPWLIEKGISGNITVLDYLKARCSAEGYTPTTNGTLPQTISPSAQNSTYGFPITFFDPLTGNWTTTTPQTNGTDINAVNGTATASANGTATATSVVSGTDASTPVATTPVATETTAALSTEAAGATDTAAVDPTATESATAGASLGVRGRKVYRGPSRVKA